MKYIVGDLKKFYENSYMHFLKNFPFSFNISSKF